MEAAGTTTVDATMGMVAFHGRPEIKEQYLARVRAHRAADEIVQSYGYWQKDDEDGRWKGCAVGCTLHSDEHGAYETELGIPRILARLEDGIFEKLPADRAKVWPEEFLGAAKVGADLSMVWPHFAYWLLKDETWGVINFAKTERSKKAIEDVAELYARVLKGETIERKEWRSAAADAYDAAASAYAADAAAYADAAAAAAAAYAYAAYAAAYADAAAAAASAYAARRSQARVAQADKLLELMAAATVPIPVAA